MRRQNELVDRRLTLTLDLPGKVLSWMGRKVGVATVAERIAVKRLKPGIFFSPAHKMRIVQTGSNKISFRTDIRGVLATASLTRPVISYLNPGAEEAVSFVKFNFSHFGVFLLFLSIAPPDVIVRFAVMLVGALVRLDLVDFVLVGGFGRFVVLVADFTVATGIVFFIDIPSSALLAADVATLTLASD
jgi:hypothetical protein